MNDFVALLLIFSQSDIQEVKNHHHQHKKRTSWLFIFPYFFSYLIMTHVEIINDVNVLLYLPLCIRLVVFLLWLLLSRSISFTLFVFSLKSACHCLLVYHYTIDFIISSFFWWYTNNYNKRFHHHKEVPTSLHIAKEHNKLLILIFLCIPCLYSISQ